MGTRRDGVGARGRLAFAAAALLVVAVACLGLVLGGAGCAFRVSAAGGGTASTTVPAAPMTLAATTSSVPAAPPASGGQAPASHVTLVFGGDLLMHVALGASVLDPATGRYDFSRIFAPISPYLVEGDLAAADLETVLAGADCGYTNYPRMNSPTDLAAELAESGFDLISTATNHTLDQGWDGLVATADVLDSAGLAHVGSYRSADERTTLLVRDVAGVKVAFLAYADRLNGLPLPADRPYAVSMLERNQVSDDVRRAHAAGAEVVVAQVHWGSEYMHQPSRPQREEARMLLEKGVDVIVGSHPHVVQPIVPMTVDRAGRPFTG
jgi:poly-gamma-glutamate capsule biosynthesis protein CapA/YwtB (metallophosphatase superfamily)